MAAKNIKPIIAGAVLSLSLTGCATTPQELRADPGGHLRAEVPVSYETAYRRVRLTFEQCHGGTLALTGALYPDVKTATVIKSNPHIAGAQPPLVIIDLAATSDTSTAIRGYYVSSMTGLWQRLAEAAPVWAVSEHVNCNQGSQL